MNKETTAFESWALVELMGHVKLAGLCSEQTVFGGAMLRVDIPETSKQPAFSRFYGTSAIYSVTPVDEKTAKELAESFTATPVQIWDVRAMLDKNEPLKKALLTSSCAPIATPAAEDDDDETGYEGPDYPY
ncbi:hypothetical protein [Paraflavitalea sp. CAU 1676]|uniref:hypothetical protein n=1 Tax=Paraflavitalea sp. CAU 1676 TaxID=3032598 RepID=UPI0023DCA7DE|nr:hypothetical protein [Paraflavitalea sp. CAU 1676]MDF2189323.1 hypothetical protein [Paraflavitalea sp. CAU 1676]